MNLLFSHIQHPARRALELTLNQYAVLDFVYICQTHPSETVDGWAKVGCHKIANELGLSSGTVKNIFDESEKKGYLEKKGKRGDLKRTTPAFYNFAYLDNLDVQKLNIDRLEIEQQGVQKLNAKCSKIEPYIISNKTNNKTIYVPPTLEEIKPMMMEALQRRFADTPDLANLMFERESKDFYEHHNAKKWANSRKGKITSIAGAIATWTKNADDWGTMRRKYAELKKGSPSLPQNTPNEGSGAGFRRVLPKSGTTTQQTLFVAPELNNSLSPEFEEI